MKQENKKKDMPRDDWIDEYVHETEYYGVIGEQYEKVVTLKFEEINNFIQNVGRHANVKIIREDDGDILLNTLNTYIDRIFPSLSWDVRSTSSCQNNVNYIANLFAEQREKDGDFPEPLPKVLDFMKDVFPREVVERDLEAHKEYLEELALEEKEEPEIEM